MSRGRRISRVKFIPPKKKVAEKYLREWNNKDLFHFPDKFPNITRRALFDQLGLISLDIGCGTGEFLNALASKNPEDYFVGIEISRRAIYYAVNQAASKQLENIIYIKADFKLLTPLFVDETLDKVYLNFPDPNYGGQKHLKHRIMTPEFLDLMSSALTQKGAIQVVTDQMDFLIDMLKIVEDDHRFQKTHKERFLTVFSPPEKTRFQKAWEKFDRSTFLFEIRRK